MRSAGKSIDFELAIEANQRIFLLCQLYFPLYLKLRSLGESNEHRSKTIFLFEVENPVMNKKASPLSWC